MEEEEENTNVEKEDVCKKVEDCKTSCIRRLSVTMELQMRFYASDEKRMEVWETKGHKSSQLCCQNFLSRYGEYGKDSGMTRDAQGTLKL